MKILGIILASLVALSSDTLFAKKPNSFSIQLPYGTLAKCQAVLEPIREKVKDELNLENLIGECVPDEETNDFGITFYTTDKSKITFYGAELSWSYTTEQLVPVEHTRKYWVVINVDGSLVSKEKGYSYRLMSPMPTAFPIASFAECRSKVDRMSFKDQCVGDMKLFKMCLKPNAVFYACVDQSEKVEH